MIQPIVVWFLLTYCVCISHLHISKQNNGVANILAISLWLVILAPTFTETNTLTFFRDVFEPNIISISISLLCLLVTGIALGLFFQNHIEENDTAQYIFVLAAAGALSVYVLTVLLFLPVNIDQCSCLYGYYGETCENSCWANNGNICSGHGTCSTNGCQCDSFFQGQTCNACINQYNYDTNCTACNQGYSLLYQCTTCTTGRDPSTACQDCFDGYLEDINYNSPALGCTVCKENYFRPSPDPLIGSYNAFLEFGTICTECPKENGNICNGHGQCQHFLLENPDGDFDYEGTTVLGQDASGACACEEGYYGPTCIKALGFDGENTESICAGNGYITTNYRRNFEDIFDTFVGLSCVCDEGWIPNVGEDACSCKAGFDTQCIECAFGFYLFNGTCNVCPGGSFTSACNMKHAGGVCNNDGTCTCKVSYVSGGYTGEDCTTCVNHNFIQVGDSCLPCAGAFSDGFSDSCGGHGVCITQSRLDMWATTDLASDSFSLYFSLAAEPKSETELANYVGKCECFDGFSLNAATGICI